MTYPAAHSMDTEWFAVDEDGVVGMFVSGEAGAVPNQAAMGMNPGDPSFDTFPLDALRVGRLAARDPIDVPPDTPARHSRVIVVLGVAQSGGDGAAGYRIPAADLAAIEAKLSKREPWVVREGDPRVIATSDALEPSEVTALEKLPGVRSVVTEDDVFDVLVDRDEIDDGLFRYANDDYDMAGRYERTARPGDPLRLGDLPEDLREEIARVRLPVRFAEQAELQLADYFDEEDCAWWAMNEVSLRGDPIGDESESAAVARSPGDAVPPAEAPATPRPGDPERPAEQPWMRPLVLGLFAAMIALLLYLMLRP